MNTLAGRTAGLMASIVESGVASHSLSIVIPAYNEELRIGKVLQELCDFITLEHAPWHVIVAVDGDDNTETVVLNFAKNYPFISYNTSEERRGKGRAIRETATMVDSEFMLILDADNSIRIDEIARSLTLLSDHDVLVFSRYAKGQGTIPIHRRVLSRGFNALVRLLFDLQISDTQTGYKIFRTSYFKRAIRKVVIAGPFYDVSLLIHLKNDGARLAEVPAFYRHGKGSKFNSFFLTLGMFAALAAYTVRYSRLYSITPEFFVRAYFRLFRWL